MGSNVTSVQPTNFQPMRTALYSPVHTDRRIACIENTIQYLLDQQQADGFWVGELQGDSILESEYILLLGFLKQETQPLGQKLARYLLTQQTSTGGWSIYPGGPDDVSATVKAYLALKITGHHADSKSLQLARQSIESNGGVEGINSFTRFYLAMLGQVPYQVCPAVPPELLLLPQRIPFNLNEMSAWTRTILVPLSIIYALQPVRCLSRERGISELTQHLDSENKWPLPHSVSDQSWMSWDRLFYACSEMVKTCDHWGLNPLRQRAVQQAKNWMIERFSNSDGLGAIFPPMVWSIIALDSLGYDPKHPVFQRATEQLSRLVIQEGDTAHVQPCLSPIWDTALTTLALREAGVPSESDPIQKSINWLFSKQISETGDWSAHRPNLTPGGWPFQFQNDFYPDLDDTAMVLMALADCDQKAPSEFLKKNRQESMERGFRWVQGLQNDDGGWAAFDVGNNRELLTHVPFADHNAILDPSTPDITGRVLEMLGIYGFSTQVPSIQRAVRYLFRSQSKDGSWYGRWGVNYIYGTWQALMGLRRVGVPRRDPRLRRAVQWLLSRQQPNGAWGESCKSYEDPTWKGRGEPTASQTAWALMGLMTAGMNNRNRISQGIEYLLETQQPDGTWDEPYFTGTGFPRVFYLKYHLYRVYFPLLALVRYEQYNQDLESQ